MTTGKGGGGPGGCSCGFNPAREFNTVDPARWGDSEPQFVFIAGHPLREPYAQHGPFVMNTKEELREAVGDYQNCRNGFEKARN